MAAVASDTDIVVVVARYPVPRRPPFIRSVVWRRTGRASGQQTNGWANELRSGRHAIQPNRRVPSAESLNGPIRPLAGSPTLLATTTRGNGRGPS